MRGGGGERQREGSILQEFRRFGVSLLPLMGVHSRCQRSHGPGTATVLELKQSAPFGHLEMDISSEERLYFDKYLNNLRQVQMLVMSLPVSLGAVLQITPKPFFSPPLPKSKQTDTTFLPVEPTRRVPLFWVIPAPYTCSSVSGRTSADMTHRSVACLPLCQVPFPKKNNQLSQI